MTLNDKEKTIRKACEVATFAPVFKKDATIHRDPALNYLAKVLTQEIGRFCSSELSRIEQGHPTHGSRELYGTVHFALQQSMYASDDLMETLMVTNVDEVARSVMGAVWPDSLDAPQFTDGGPIAATPPPSPQGLHPNAGPNPVSTPRYDPFPSHIVDWDSAKPLVAKDVHGVPTGLDYSQRAHYRPYAVGEAAEVKPASQHDDYRRAAISWTSENNIDGEAVATASCSLCHTSSPKVNDLYALETMVNKHTSNFCMYW